MANVTERLKSGIAYDTYGASAIAKHGQWGATAATAPDKTFSLVHLGRAKSLNIVGSLLILVITYLLWEQANYRRKKAHLPGSSWTIPIIGGLIHSMNPSVENYSKGWSIGPLSVAKVLHIFIVMANSNELARKVLNNPSYTEPCLTSSSKSILEADNFVFLSGKAHTDYRRGLNALFTRRALGIYLGIQEEMYRKRFADWLALDFSKGALPFQMRFRDLNMDVSLRVFCGGHIPPAVAQGISDKYWAITQALELVNIPLAIPGTNVWRAVRARKYIQKAFEDAAKASRRHLEQGGQVGCMLDAWIKDMIDSQEAIDAGDDLSPRKRAPIDFSDRQIGLTVLTFLFASQDAMTSGLTFAFQHLADRPDILAKVRTEQLELRDGSSDVPMTMDMIEKMTYTKAFIKESLRLRPPVIFVPYSAKQAYKIDGEYTIPKNTMVIPSFWPSLHDDKVYPEPDRLVPERWLDPQSSASTNPKNYLVFGAGAHRCLGNEYAVQHLTACVGTASILLDWTHARTAESEKMNLICTVFPADQCPLTFAKRQAGQDGKKTQALDDQSVSA